MLKRWILALVFALGALAHGQTYAELDQLGTDLYRKGDYAGALEAFTRSLALKEAQLGPEDPLTAQAHGLLGTLHTRLNNYPQAIEQYQAAQRILDKVRGPDHPDSATNRFYLGGVYSALDDYPKALEAYAAARASFDRSLGPGNPQSALVLQGVSFVQMQLGDYPKALQTALESAAALEKALGPDHSVSASAYERVAEVYGYLGDTANRLEYLGRALRAKEKSLGPADPQVAWTLINLGQTYRAQGDFARALGTLQRAVDIFSAAYGPEHPVTAENLPQLARVYADLKNYPRAVETQQRAIAALARAFGPASLSVAVQYNLLGLFYLGMDDPAKAREAYGFALEIQRKTFGPNSINTATSLAAVGGTYLRQRDYAKALEYDLQALDAFLGQQEVSFSALDNPAKVRYKQSNAQFANSPLLALTLQENPPLRLKQAVLSGWLSFKGAAFALENGLWVLGQQHDPALQRGLAEYQALRTRLADLYTRAPQDEAQARQTQATIAQVSGQISALEAGLAKGAGGFADLLAARRVTWQQLAAQLKPGELYLDYAWFDNGVYALTLDAKGRVEVQALVSAGLLERLVGALRTALEGRKGVQELYPQNLDLYRALLGPIEPALADAHTLVISPDGPLAFLPFELLSDGEKLLLERFTVRYIPTGRDLLRLRTGAKAAPGGPAAVFGNPAFAASPNPAFAASAPAGGTRASEIRTLAELLRRANLSPLPGTEAEARGVAGMLGPQTRVFLGEAANEKNLLSLEAPRVLHIATHGFFVNDARLPNPLLRVGLALSGARASVAQGESYGLLTALQLSSMRLRGTELVVLSACETGLGDAVAGEGVAGLNQAFLTAGARQVMLSLWKVPDAETADLMQSFYRLWLGGKPEAEALRGAKLELMRRGLAPWYWAAFLLSGG